MASPRGTPRLVAQPMSGSSWVLISAATISGMVALRAYQIAPPTSSQPAVISSALALQRAIALPAEARSGTTADILHQARGYGQSPQAGDSPLPVGLRRSPEMCRWMAWLGQPVLIEELLFKTQHGIVDQSLHARMGAEPTNGDGFGLGWYGSGEGPAVYRSVSPAWSDPNLRELAAHTESPLFLTHVRAAIGSPVQETNCHPFRRGRWLFVHNGYIADFHLLRRT